MNDSHIPAIGPATIMNRRTFVLSAAAVPVVAAVGGIAAVRAAPDVAAILADINGHPRKWGRNWEPTRLTMAEFNSNPELWTHRVICITDVPIIVYRSRSGRGLNYGRAVI